MPDGQKRITRHFIENSQPLDDLLEENDKGQDFYADSAYIGDVQEKVISKYKMENKVHEKGYRNKPLTEEQKANNLEKSIIKSTLLKVSLCI